MSQLFLYILDNSGDVSIVSISFEESRGCLSCFYIFGRVLRMPQLFLYFGWNSGDVSAGFMFLVESWG